MNPGHKPPNLETWANEIRLMREIDKKSDQEIRDLFEYANNDRRFWRKTILSPEGLRRNWDKVIVDKNNPKERPKGKQARAREAIRERFSGS